MSSLINKVFYGLKPLIPRSIQLYLRRRLINLKMSKYESVWPILEEAGAKPFGFQGWPESKKFAVVLTHDVELIGGLNKVKKLLDVEKKLGFVSSFNFVPERYSVDPELRSYIRSQGFEVGVHGLYHDGKLFQSKKTFDTRVPQINRYLKEWQAVGFRSPAMHHNLDWIGDLDVKYDLSTFDTDPFEPQSDGVKTIFPFWVGTAEKGYVELPYTLSQDFTPYVLMKETTIDIWKKKVDWIVSKGGMVLVNVHPDYLSFDGNKPGMEEFPVEMYQDLLLYIQTRFKDQYWHSLPKEMAQYWKEEIIARN